jgi:outer membrane receptor for ferrienterochelin and colicins
VGTGIRYTNYDDNTPATADLNLNNKPSVIYLPGIFVQDEIALTSTQTLLVGARYDYYKQHGSIFSPRINYKIQPNKFNTVRLSLGNGFRVVNLFTEDHAALTGAREVIIQSSLKPEQSWNGNLNYTRFINKGKGFVTMDATLFYTYFNNRIIANYDIDPNKIIYDNLNGYAISRGLSLYTDITFGFPLKLNIGITWMNVFKTEKDSNNIYQKSVQIHAPKFSSTFQLSYTLRKINLTIDYTGQLYSPMRLPVLPNDFRPEFSPWFSIQNVQLTKKLKNNWQIYLGVKNVFNFMPQNPIMRAFDPFDKRVNENNPNAYTFDPSYNYAPLQGRRVVLGIRYILY